jgi:L-malate glycosyltransferase
VSVWRAASQVDVLHVFSASYSSFVLNCIPAWLISRLCQKRFLLNYHTAREWQKLASSLLVRFILRRTETIVVPSLYLAAKFEQIGIAVSIVPNIIDEDHFQYRPRIPLRPNVICTRNLSPDYGMEVVIHAFAIVQQHYPDAMLYLVGDGPLRNNLEILARALRVSHIIFCGALPNEKVAECYKQADIFVNGSVLDNAPLSILEAMASGVPVVTTAAGGIPHMVKHEETALVCPVGDWLALAEQVMRLLREPELGLQIARRAYEQVFMHSWPLIRKKWLDVYAGEILSAAKDLKSIGRDGQI